MKRLTVLTALLALLGIVGSVGAAHRTAGLDSLAGVRTGHGYA